MQTPDLRPGEEHAGTADTAGTDPGRRTLTQGIQRKAASGSAPPTLQLSPAPGAAADPFDFGYAVQRKGDGATPDASAAAAPKGTATPKVAVNVRAAASTKAEVLGTAAPGTALKVQATTGAWHQIEHEGGTAFVTSLPAYVDFHPAPAKPAAPAEHATTPTPTAKPKDEGSWLDDALGAAHHLVDSVMSFFGGDADEHRDSEAAGKKEPAAGKESATDAGKDAGKEAAKEAAKDAKDEQPTAPSGELLFKRAFEIICDDAKLRDAAFKATGKTVAKGTRVFAAKADRTYVQIVTSADAAEKIVDADNVWTAFSNLGGTGSDVALGNEKTDAADKTKADTLRAGMPSGRKPGQSAFKWTFGAGFMPSLEGKALDGSLMGKLQHLMDWAIENDMVTGDIVLGDGMRGPKTAHRMCVSWNIQNRWDKVVTLANLKALAGGKDEDGNVWYKDEWGDDVAKIKAHAHDVRASSAIAAAGHQKGEGARSPLPINASPGVSRHCTGGAVDVTIPWRAPGKDAAENGTDLWAWEDVYKQFGLHRPLHRDLQSQPGLQEHWHIEETSKHLDGDEETDS